MQSRRKVNEASIEAWNRVPVRLLKLISPNREASTKDLQIESLATITKGGNICRYFASVGNFPIMFSTSCTCENCSFVPVRPLVTYTCKARRSRVQCGRLIDQKISEKWALSLLLKKSVLRTGPKNNEVRLKKSYFEILFNFQKLECA